MNTVEFAESIISQLNSQSFIAVWESLKPSDRKLSETLMGLDNVDFAVVYNDEVIVFREYPDGWDYYYLGEPAIELPTNTDGSVVAWFTDQLPGVSVRLIENPTVTPLHSEFMSIFRAIL